MKPVKIKWFNFMVFLTPPDPDSYRDYRGPKWGFRPIAQSEI